MIAATTEEITAELARRDRADLARMRSQIRAHRNAIATLSEAISAISGGELPGPKPPRPPRTRPEAREPGKPREAAPERVAAALRFLEDHPRASEREVRESVGGGREACRNALRSLLAGGLIIAYGSTKKRRYSVDIPF